MKIIDNNQNYSKLEILIATGQVVFNINDLCILWLQPDRTKVSNLASWYINSGKMFRLASGLYCLKENYGNGNLEEKLVIAQKALAPSYISYHTALYQNGINFQYYSPIHCCSLGKKILKIDKQGYIYHKIPDRIFFNPKGIIKNEFGYSIACVERAICDSWLINNTLGLDNINKVDTKLLLELALIYNSPKIWKNIKLFFGIGKPKV